MTGWRTVKLKDVCQRITVGHVGSMAGEYKESGIPFLRSLNITPFRLSHRELKFIDRKFHEKLKKSVLKPGDIAIVRTGYPGTACVIPEGLGEANCSDLVLVTPGVDLNPHFLAAIFNSTFGKDLVGGNLVGAAQQHFNITTAKELKLHIPPKATQDKISAILTAYDDLIETNKRRIALLETMAEELYREWFVRMRFPGHKNTKFVKGVPEGWEQKRFGDFCMLKRGYDLPKDLVEEGPYPVVASTSVKTFHKHYKVEPPVITTGRSGSLGEVLITHSRAWPLNTALYVRKFFGNSPYLVFYTLKNMGLESFNSGAGVPTLNRNHVNGIPMVLPDKNLQQRFEEQVEPIHKQVENLRLSNVTLTKTRDLLLPRLISGKLSVEDLEIQFPPSMQGDIKP